MEIVVPYDETVGSVDSLAAQFPSVRFVAMGSVATRRPERSHAGQHELYDRRRARGLAEARGELIAILEDRGIPRPDWAQTLHDLHELPHSVIGGAIDNAVDRPLNWAVFFCDFGRYQLPLAPRPARFVSDINICYKRGALDSAQELWKDRYHETTVHWAMLRAGHTLFLDPRPVVEQRREALKLGALLRERFHWGRLFAYTRVRECGTARRIVLALASPLLPLALFVRTSATQLRKRTRLGRFLIAAPAVMLLLIAWSLGEAVGYVTGDC
jgi:hypothetical protein